MNKNKIQSFWADKKRLFTYILIWLATLVATMLVFKGPNMLIYQINNDTFTPVNFIKSVLLVEKTTTKPLLAVTDTTALTTQTAIDQTVVNTAILTPAQCKQTTFTKEELSGGTKKAIVGNEDVGRYVGYGWKEITKGGGLNLGYGLLRLFYPANDTCYGTNGAAKLLCTNAQAIETFNVPVLQKMFTQVQQGSVAYNLLS